MAENQPEQSLKRNLKALVAVTLVLGVVSLFLERTNPGPQLRSALSVLDYVILFLILFELAVEYRTALYKSEFLKRNVFSLSLVAVYVVLFIYIQVVRGPSAATSVSTSVMVIRNVFLLLKVFTRVRKLASYIENISSKPAQTILLSFLMVILVGTLLLMMPFASADRISMSFTDALFTSTSAVCVTGLIVVDTATAFSGAGKLIIMVLIQIGGLGIMIISFFTIFIVRRSLSVEDKLLISYMLSERDMTGLTKSLLRIVLIAFGVEMFSAVLLFFGLGKTLGYSGQTAFTALFHSVSAFCNAGFSLFSDSLERFRDDAFVIGVIAFLIIAGGISFVVMVNIWNNTRLRLRNRFRPDRTKVPKLTPNTKLVLWMTAGLLVSSFLLFYALEHDNTLSHYAIGEQYLSAFFQAVTLRTAGFNSVPFGSLTTATYLMMTIYMFIGAASGSTAGGIKINTLGIIGAYVVSVLRNRPAPIIDRSSVAVNLVLRAFMVLLLGTVAITIGTLLLSITEDGPLQHIFFEVVSAFGTVGLSAGITAGLTKFGKYMIIVLMYIGRLGPLTLITGAALTKRTSRAEYPNTDILIG